MYKVRVQVMEASTRFLQRFNSERSKIQREAATGAYPSRVLPSHLFLDTRSES